MKINQLYTKCLAQGAYYIESKGEVAIVDPLREVEQYVQMAKESGATIKYIFETHFHADFVSGHVTLAEKTGAAIVYGPNANTTFKTISAKDNQEFKVGDLTIRVLHTPGHTMESTTYLLIDENGKEQAIFTGDTLFLGDVGRPDLAQKGAEITQEDLAGILFDSLRNKIMTLPDDVTIYPGHGAGSACGKSMSNETIGNLGEQKKTNYALRANMTKAEFIKELTDGLTPPPAYFPLNVKLNKEGYESVHELINNIKPLTANDIKSLTSETVLLDVRHQNVFVEAHIPNSIFIGIDGGFAPWVGAVLKDTNTPIVLIADETRLDEVITRLSRVGFDNVLGYLKGGVEAWKEDGNELASIESIDVTEFESRFTSDLDVIDVRKPSEYDNGHVKDVILAPLAELGLHEEKFKGDAKSYIYCGGGYRSVIASSLLKRKGIHSIVDVKGGYGAIKNAGLPLAKPETV